MYSRNGKEQGIVYAERRYRFSKLEFDQSNFEKLNQKSFEQNQLLELQELREGKQQQRVKGVKQLGKDKSLTNAGEEKELHEMQKLREKEDRKERILELSDEENISSTEKSSIDYDRSLYTEDGVPLFSPFAFVKPNLFIDKDEE